MFYTHTSFFTLLIKHHVWKHASIPSSVTPIGKSAIRGCQYLLEIAIPSSVTSIGDYALS